MFKFFWVNVPTQCVSLNLTILEMFSYSLIGSLQIRMCTLITLFRWFGLRCTAIFEASKMQPRPLCRLLPRRPCRHLHQSCGGTRPNFTIQTWFFPQFSIPLNVLTMKISVCSMLWVTGWTIKGHTSSMRPQRSWEMHKKVTLLLHVSFNWSSTNCFSLFACWMVMYVELVNTSKIKFPPWWLTWKCFMIQDEYSFTDSIDL